MTTNHNREQMLSRQSDMVPDLERLHVAIVGAGGIGSNVADVLARMGVMHFTLVDPDTVARENIYPGAFSTGSVGRAKVLAVADHLAGDLGVTRGNIQTIVSRFNPAVLEGAHIVLSGPDNMDARREVWSAFRDTMPDNTLLIDARMGGVGFEVFAVENGDEERSIRYNDDVSELDDQPLPCGEKATAMITHMIGGVVGTIVREFARGATPPFQTFYDADLRLYAVAS
jgi:molybdopterin/thiamine biosynthesis adenylyltransferase